MSDQLDDDRKTNTVIKASFPIIDPKIVGRVREIAGGTILPTDPKFPAGDLQTVAVLALQVHESAEMLIRLMQQIGKAGAINIDPSATLPATR